MSSLEADRRYAQFVDFASRFQHPEDLIERLEPLRARIPTAELLTSPKHKVLKEAWHAGVFGLGMRVAFEEASAKEAVYVRLAEPEPYPDFQLRLLDQTYDFEVTSTTDRATGELHRRSTRIGPPRPSWIVDEEVPPLDSAALAGIIRKKLEKHYAPPAPNLLVYVVEGKGMTMEAVRAAVNEGGGVNFASVWVLTTTHLGVARPFAGFPDRPGGWWRIPNDAK